MLLLVTKLSAQTDSPYSIQAIKYGTMYFQGDTESSKIGVTFMLFLLKSKDKTILIDAGFYKPEMLAKFQVKDFISPADAVQLVGVKPTEVTDIIISHAHLDHIGAIDLFPNATIWMQQKEYEYYTGLAWQTEGKTGGLYWSDVVTLVQKNTEGKVKFVDGSPAYIFACDDVPFYRLLEERKGGALFEPNDAESSKKAVERMISLAGGIEKVIPGHDVLLFEKSPTKGRVATIR
jgi:glyoxylase-like metal-dependent hydrolase (beta-lactamase superfamily II)